MLKTKGCLVVDDEMAVIDYEDKPSQKTSRFNGYWCGFAFKKGAFDNCISFMEQSTLNLNRQRNLNSKSILWTFTQGNVSSM